MKIVVYIPKNKTWNSHTYRGAVILLQSFLGFGHAISSNVDSNSLLALSRPFTSFTRKGDDSGPSKFTWSLMTTRVSMNSVLQRGERFRKQKFKDLSEHERFLLSEELGVRCVLVFELKRKRVVSSHNQSIGLNGHVWSHCYCEAIRHSLWRRRIVNINRVHDYP